MSAGIFNGLKNNHYQAILADPPWSFRLWSDSEKSHGCAKDHYPVMDINDISSLPVSDLAAENSVLFLWMCWPLLPDALKVIKEWGFEFKTCAFCWMKADVSTINLFDNPVDAYMGMGYWTRANSEACLLATRGKPKKLSSAVRQGIIAPRREHSRKPDGVHGRIEQLVDGPYLELFCRQKRNNWDCWGNETNKFEAVA